MTFTWISWILERRVLKDIWPSVNKRWTYSHAWRYCSYLAKILPRVSFQKQPVCKNLLIRHTGEQPYNVVAKIERNDLKKKMITCKTVKIWIYVDLHFKGQMSTPICVRVPLNKMWRCARIKTVVWQKELSIFIQDTCTWSFVLVLLRYAYCG